MNFYYGLCSGNSARALFGLLESGAPFTQILVDTQSGENSAAGYRAVNPMGKIPALEDGDFKLWESNAINWYAAELNPGAKLLPETPAGRASLHRWLFFQSAHVSPACIAVFRATNPRVQKFWKTQGDARAHEAAVKELARFLPVVEEGLAGRDWLEGTFGLADIAFSSHLLLVREGGFDFSPYPRMQAWMNRIAARPAWIETAGIIGAPL